jgi:hypothetical protein
MACYAVVEDLPAAEFRGDGCIEGAETGRDHPEKSLAIVT